MSLADTFDDVLDQALTEIAREQVPVFTLAFYHDHESHAISVCVDTEENSTKAVRSSNSFASKDFHAAIRAGDLAEARLWQSNIGRSLSLGDFALVNVARTDLDEAVEANSAFYLAMVRTIVEKHPQVAKLAADPERLVLAFSGPDEEVALVWSLPTNT